MILDQIISLFPGTIEENDAYVDIHHDRGDTSTLWKWQSGASALTLPTCLNDFYTHYEAADLLSSTFKISSPDRTMYSSNGVALVGPWSELVEDTLNTGAAFPKDAIPFMLEPGGWLYAASPSRNKLLVWDFELSALNDEFDDLLAVLRNWKSAIDEEAG